jgi:hypothetical protein
MEVETLFNDIDIKSSLIFCQFRDITIKEHKRGLAENGRIETV